MSLYRHYSCCVPLSPDFCVCVSAFWSQSLFSVYWKSFPVKYLGCFLPLCSQPLFTSFWVCQNILIQSSVFERTTGTGCSWWTAVCRWRFDQVAPIAQRRRCCDCWSYLLLCCLFLMFPSMLAPLGCIYNEFVCCDRCDCEWQQLEHGWFCSDVTCLGTEEQSRK